jgi:hypothetical protein
MPTLLIFGVGVPTREELAFGGGGAPRPQHQGVGGLRAPTLILLWEGSNLSQC